jgi:all-trans-retinol 13,14-reductase
VQVATEQSPSNYDAIVIGSGMGGLACACALPHMGYKVLVLEQHFVAGGLTQSFERDGFRWDVGVHYLGGMGEGGAGRKVLDWLCSGAIQFTSMGPVYDAVHFPQGFQLQFARPEQALKLELQERFPDSCAELDAFFTALADAERASRPIFAQRAMPALVATLYRFMHEGEIEKWWGRSTAAVLREPISDSKRRAVLAAQRGDYGPLPAQSSFGMHELIMRHYFGGVYYPQHGARAFADALVPMIEKGGGQVKVRAADLFRRRRSQHRDSAVACIAARQQLGARDRFTGTVGLLCRHVPRAAGRRSCLRGDEFQPLVLRILGSRRQPVARPRKRSGRTGHVHLLPFAEGSGR